MPSSRWFAWAELPDDLQTLLSDYLEIGPDWTPPSGLWSHPLDLARLPAAPLDDAHAPLSSGEAQAQGVDRGVAYARSMDLATIPPIVIGQGRWLDGRHRVFAAREQGQDVVLAFDLTLLVPPGHLAQFSSLGEVAPLYRVHRIMAGQRHDNPLPPPPPGRKLERLWTLLHADRLAQIGPEHNASAFLEDRIHDYQVDAHGNLRFYSRIVASHTVVEVVLDYETAEERKARLTVRPPTTPAVPAHRSRRRP